jgi:SAM-dependent methyltransferase
LDLPSHINLACPACNQKDILCQEISNLIKCCICGHRWIIIKLSPSYYSELIQRNNPNSNSTHFKINERTQYITKWINHFFKNDLKILEVGCAEGFLGKEIKRLFSHVEYSGVELSRDAILASKFLDKVYDYESSLIKDKKYDMILSFHVLEHIADIQKEVVEWSRLLKTDGIVVVEVPNRSGHPLIEIDHNPEHLHQFTIISLIMIFSRNGFEVCESYSNKFESVLYPDSLRVVFKKKLKAQEAKKILNDKFSVLASRPLLAWGLGGDFQTYVKPFLDDLKFTYLVDSSPQKIGLNINGINVEFFQIEKHHNANILICSESHKDSIMSELRKFDFPENQIFTLADLYEES